MSINRRLPPSEPDPSKSVFDTTLGREKGRGRMEGRKVIVVGGGQRITSDVNQPVGNGHAICRILAREGAQVACLDQSAESAQTVCDAIAAEGGVAYPVVVDVRDVPAIEPAVAESARLMGGVDGLVLNVGITSVAMDQLTVDHWNDVININLRSHVWFAKAALSILQPGSSIVLSSSRSGIRPGSRAPAYEATKAAQLQLTRTIALEGHARGIRCNCVVIGPVDSPMGREEAKRRSDRGSSLAFGRQATAWEMAYVALFFLSRETSYVNAQQLVVDGGQFFGIAGV